MGGCCCSSRKSNVVGTPVYYYCPESFEELRPSGAHAGVGSAFTTTGLLVDLGLETSIPDTFCAPAPLPYDLLLGRRHCADSESGKGRISESSFETLAACEDLAGLDCKTQPSSVVLSPRKSDFSNQNGWKQLVDEEEDSCPICFEDYDVENPKLTTKCDHDFHLSCLLEWIERSDSCPICDKEVVFADCLN
ncbi:unnamed protein product [Thlaspi arvense]|uniref:RING-type E3 ubiquitin transferase n=1 Tax=Thlaspi arvense TaxID=13288 RepID=A0AAU9SL44_THLAR|nr:unnamed protein product [Thlaspi arvense]